MARQALTIVAALLFGAVAWQGPLRAAPPGAADEARPGPIHQLRVYEMVERNEDAFNRRFRDHALRIMRSHGFNVVAIWESRPASGPTEFVYLLQWPDKAAKDKAWAAFMADEEWKAIKRESVRTLDGPIMGEILEDKTLELVDYSPRRDLLDGG
jgi:heme-degrading monooxygenase HmoA